jgi:hypothetical protein
MSFRFFLLLPLLPFLALHAAETTASRKLLVAAVGDIPVPKLKVSEATGWRGYVEDESSTTLFFPKSWDFKFAGATATLELGLNQEPSMVAVPEGITEMTLQPNGRKPSERQPKPQSIPAPAVNGPSMLIVFNRNPNTAWIDSFSSAFTSCPPLDPAKPSAMILNLSGATLTFMGRDRANHSISPGASALVPILVNDQQNVKMLPISAAMGKTIYNLDICPIETSGPYCPVVAVYPRIAMSKQVRPLKTSIIQPSYAVPLPKSLVKSQQPN